MTNTNTNRIDVETENQILSIGTEFLPAVARKVRDGEELTAAERAEYEEWLAGQVAQIGEQ